MIIKSHSKDYELTFEEGFCFVAELGRIPNKLVVVDRNVLELFKDSVFSKFAADELFPIDALESHKCIDTALSICEKMTTLPGKKNAVIIAFGGGIVQDITGFAANILYRGVKWLFIPTTLLAQADSCIGSKTSLNYLQFKNLLGTFYPPDHVYVCLDFLKTLSRTDYHSGLGEVVKFNIMAGADGLELIEKDIDALLARNSGVLRSFVERSLQYKKTFIEEDEFDKGIRNLLNFAHTFGHAFEAISDYAIPHGQAVLLGMIIANRISCKRGVLSMSLLKRIEALCCKVISIALRDEWFAVKPFVAAMSKDKKRKSANLAAVLLTNDFSLALVQDLCEEEVEIALRDLCALLVSNTPVVGK